MKSFSPIQYFILLFLASLTPSTLKAELTISGQVSAGNTYQEVKTQSNGTRSLNTVELSPTVNAKYRSKYLNGLWSSSVTHLERDRSDLSTTDTYGDYNYQLNWAPLPNVLLIEASGFLNYRNANTANFLVSDFFTNSEDLVKVRSNRVSSFINLDKGNWLNGEGTIAFSDTASDSSNLGNNALNNSSALLSGSVSNGNKLDRVIFELSGQYEDTEREDNFAGDFITRKAAFFSDFVIFSDWALRATAFHEGNQVSSRLDSSSTVRQFNSYGIGITYRQSASRYIAVTMNKSDSNDEENIDDTFVGLDVGWALSARTNFKAKYGRRFFGESASADFSYNSKFFRSSFKYSEDVTNTSRLLANQENLGVFVCPLNSFSIADCFQPNSLSYTPTIDEQLVQLSDQNIELQDNVILRKSGNFQAGYDFSRITVAVSWRYSEDEYLDFERLRRTYSFGTSLSYQLGKNTSIFASLDYANINDKSDDENFNGEGDNYNFNAGINREFGKSLIMALDFTYLKQEGDIISGFSAFGSNFTDRRLSASITYTYD